MLKKAEIGSVSVDVPEDFPFLIEALCRADGDILSVGIEPCEMLDMMISTGYVTDVGGAFAGTDKLREDKDRILTAFRGTMN
jgi:hypothetical protein